MRPNSVPETIIEDLTAIGTSSAKISMESSKQREVNSFPFSSFLSEDEALAHLAQMLVAAYFKQKAYDSTNKTQ